ncbi:hypothetical protein ACLQ3C_09800 [Gordonia sp. DT30]|uniref:hypothetical protein n=1 Tax=Gordonia sp. DT30 TaxID=3416546 RepID=UPI003CED98B2
MKVSGDDVVLRQQQFFANVNLWMTISFGMMLCGCVGHLLFGDDLDFRIILSAIGSLGFTLWYGYMAFLGRGPIKLNGDLIALAGARVYLWSDVEVRYTLAGEYAATVLLRTLGEHQRVVAKFAAVPLGLNFNTLLSTLVQTKERSVAGDPLTAEEIRAMLLTPVPDPLPAIGEYVDVMVHVP